MDKQKTLKELEKERVDLLSNMIELSPEDLKRLKQIEDFIQFSQKDAD